MVTSRIHHISKHGKKHQVTNSVTATIQCTVKNYRQILISLVIQAEWRHYSVYIGIKLGKLGGESPKTPNAYFFIIQPLDIPLIWWGKPLKPQEILLLDSYSSPLPNYSPIQFHGRWIHTTVQIKKSKVSDFRFTKTHIKN